MARRCLRGWCSLSTRIASDEGGLPRDATRADVAVEPVAAGHVQGCLCSYGRLCGRAQRKDIDELVGVAGDGRPTRCSTCAATPRGDRQLTGEPTLLAAMCSRSAAGPSAVDRRPCAGSRHAVAARRLYRRPTGAECHKRCNASHQLKRCLPEQQRFAGLKSLCDCGPGDHHTRALRCPRPTATNCEEAG